MKTQNSIKTHTPTPWTRGANFDIGIVGDGYAGGGRTVLHVSNSFGEDIRNANADFIVRAVNSHEALLRVVKAMRSFIEKEHTDGTPEFPREDWDFESITLVDVDEAIKQAEGGN